AIMKTRFSRCVALLLMVFTVGALAQDKPATDPDLGGRIINAVAFDGRLWVTGRNWENKRTGDALVSFSLADGSRILHFPDGVVAMARGGRHLWLLQQTATSF